MEAIKFIGLLSLIWLFVKGSSPIEFIKNLLNIHSDTTTKNAYLIVISKLVNCALCSGFWIGLAYYQDLLMACLVSICAEIFSRLIDFILIKVFK